MHDRAGQRRGVSATSSLRFRPVVAAVAVVVWLLATVGPAGAQQYTVDGSLTLDADTVTAGQTVTVTGTGFAPNSEVDIVLVGSGGGVQGLRSLRAPARGSVSGTLAQQDAEQDLGSVTADADGAISAEVTLPDDFTGNGVLYARGTTADGGTRELGVRFSNGSVVELAFTGSSGRTTSLALVAAGMIVLGGLILVPRMLRAKP